MPSTPPVSELLLRWEEAREQGKALLAEELCRDCPELCAEVSAKIRKLEALYDRLLSTDDASTAPPVDAGRTAAPEPAHGPAVPGYEIKDVLGQGGMGIVYRARDLRLNREVAVKFLRDDGPADPDAAARFTAEAQISGQLQHPGIPAVHELGTLPDGQPFLAMKFVKGQTLATLLHERTDPSQQRGHFLAIFEQICQAVGFAHAHRVIHRDLKPGNVMVGAFGEVQVMDWGLAKVLPRDGTPPPADPKGELPATVAPVTAIETPPGGGSGTRTGQVMGTPAYMAPEQAGGEVRRLDARSDVFGLGAILCQVLTGRPPYEGPGVNEVRLQAVRGELDDALARLDACGAEPDLVALGKRCLAFRQEDRPADGGAVAAAVAGIRAAAEERARKAERERGEALVREAEQRKRRRVWLALAASLLVLALVGGGFGLWWKQQHDAIVGAVTDHLDKAEQLRDAEHWDQARQTLDRAEARLAGAGPAGLRQRLQELREQLNVVRRLDDARIQRLILVDGKFDYAGADRAYLAVFAGLGLDPLVQDATALAEQIGRTPLRKQLAVALNHWAFVKNRLHSRDEARLLAVSGLVDDDPWRRQLRDSSVRKDSAKLQRLAEEKELLTQPSANLFLLGMLLKLAQSPATAEWVFRQAQQQYPNDFWINFELATHLAQQKSSNKEEALGYCRVALALQPESVAVYNNLGILLQDQQKLVEAEAAYRKALWLQPDLARAWNNLGSLLARQKRQAEAEAAFRKAIEAQHDNAPAWSNLGSLLKNQNKPREAEAAFRKAIEAQPDGTPAWYNLGLLLKDQKRLDEAESNFRKVIQLQADLAEGWVGLGSLLLESRPKLMEAAAAFRKAIEVQPDNAVAWYNLGIVLERQEKPTDAEAAYLRAIEAQPNYGPAWYNLGILLVRQQKSAEAAFRKAVETRPDYAPAWYNLGLVLAGQKKRSEAEAAYREAIQLWPDFAQAHCNLGFSLRNQGHFDEAIASFRKGHDLGSRKPAWPYPSAQWLRETERLAELDAKLPAILKGEMKPAAAELLELARLCRLYRQLHAASIRFYRHAFTTEPRLASANRYDAACSAALAGCGKGKDADQTDEQERIRLRGQALAWLQDDLAARSTLLKDNPEKHATTVRQTMQQWQQDADLAGVRDTSVLAKLPADERKQWRQFWADVADVLQHCNEQDTSEPAKR